MVHLSQLSKHYGPKVLFTNADFQIRPGEKIGLVGPNGAGKTTIFRLIVREERPDTGSITVSDKLKIGYFSQDVGEMAGRSALEEVMAASPKLESVSRELKTIESKLSATDDSAPGPDEMEKLLERYGQLQTDFDHLGGYTIENRAQEILTGLGIGPNDYNRPCESFSGGWKMRIALAKILALEPDLLLIDEPTNHLDMESIIWLEAWLVAFKGAVIMTSHDRDFMNRIVSRIVEVANQAITSYSGNYDFYERERHVRLEQLIAAQARQTEMLAKEEEFIARFAARASHAAQVQSRVKKIEKIERIEIPQEEQTMAFEFPEPPRGGDEVVKFTDLGKTWTTEDGQNRLVFQGASALVKRLDRVAVVGVNGAGKSTLLKIIAGHTAATAGQFAVGASIEVGYFSQSALDVLNPEKTIFDEVHDRIPTASQGFVRNLLGAFRFSGEAGDKKIRVLSGGEKSRVVLATILAKPINLLILDEPTNHLDIKSREVLLEAIEKFQGTVLIVSHDRFFLRRIATRVFELDRHRLQVYDGNFEYYMQKKTSLEPKSS